MKWYTVNQNNSGGYFIENEDVHQYLSIQAETEDSAKEKFYSVISEYSEFCECCGERWYWSQRWEIPQ